MANVEYIGPFRAVDLPVGGRLVTVKRGEAVEVDDAHAASLCEQTDNWRAVKAVKPPVAPTKKDGD